jgi:pimeloyl-ACP methyl ester carboxylesterase
MTNPKLHIIYIPGLGDSNPTSQRRVVATWKWWGVSAELFQMNWQDSVSWEDKFERLLERIDTVGASGQRIALVGASAGASAAINAYAARLNEVTGVVCIAGKINRPEAIGPRYRQNNPSFIPSAYQAPESLMKIDGAHRRRILCRYAPIDEVVRRSDSQIPGAHNHLSPTIGHVPTIALGITLGAPGLIHFLKRQAKHGDET